MSISVRTARQRLRASCVALVREVTLYGASTFGSNELPVADVTVRFLERTDPGRYSGREVHTTEPDVAGVLFQIRSLVEKLPSWETAKASVQSYVDIHRVKPASFITHDIPSHYLWPLIVTYFQEARAFAFIEQGAMAAANRLLRHLDSTSVEIFALIALENFVAERAFALEPYMHVHPIREPELHLLGRDDGLISPWPTHSRDLPRTDWWICEITLPNPRGTAEGWNKVHEVFENVLLAFRSFKEGAMSGGVGIQRVKGRFGGFATGRGGRLQKIALTGEKYRLWGQEIRKFIVFWKRFQALVEREQHYLQLPSRRLRLAGTRPNREDALVDYVIGLEALLGTEEERTELGFRFRVRGAVVLSKRREERKENMRRLRDLYELRSRVVHGQLVPAEALEKALPFAEAALRTTWHWYFGRWYNEKDNKRGIAMIDQELIGGR